MQEETGAPVKTYTVKVMSNPLYHMIIGRITVLICANFIPGCDRSLNTKSPYGGLHSLLHSWLSDHQTTTLPSAVNLANL
jgi:hypothetical protein